MRQHCRGSNHNVGMSYTMADGKYMRLCSVGTCGGKHKAQGYCLRHYRQHQAGCIKPDAYQCAHCAKALEGKQSNAMYCGNACKHASWVQANPEQVSTAKPEKVSSFFAGYCKSCGDSFCARRARTYCQPSCRMKTQSVYVSCTTEVKSCLTCRSVFTPKATGGKRSDYCCGECKLASEKRIKRTARLKRKVSQRAATVESVDPFKVFDRDGWRCQLCRCKTPKSKRGTYNNNAPELDHIIPLAKGGDHSYLNTQCCCRSCNAIKSDKPLGQMLLVG